MTVATVKLPGSAAFAEEAGRLRDAVNAQYAVLLGLDFPAERRIANELVAHNVSLWTLDDLLAVLECHLHHPINWTTLRTLYGAGRVADAVALFRAEHLHGAHTRARLALRYAIEEGLAYQRSVISDESLPTDALLTPEAITLLVNQRMAREGMSGRCSAEDIREAIALAVPRRWAMGSTSMARASLSRETGLPSSSLRSGVYKGGGHRAQADRMCNL